LGEEDEVEDGEDVVVGDVGVGRGECEVLCPVSVWLDSAVVASSLPIISAGLTMWTLFCELEARRLEFRAGLKALCPGFMWGKAWGTFTWESLLFGDCMCLVYLGLSGRNWSLEGGPTEGELLNINWQFF